MTQQHELALITGKRVVCSCGWHKRIPERGRGQAVILRHIRHPEEAATHADYPEDHQNCELTDMPGNGWLYCGAHQRWVTRPEQNATNNQQELSFT